MRVLSALLLLAGVGVIATSGVMYYFDRPPSLEVTLDGPREFDLIAGDVIEGDFVVRNESDHTIKVHRLALPWGCGCAGCLESKSVPEFPIHLKPGEKFSAGIVAKGRWDGVFRAPVTVYIEQKGKAMHIREFEIGFRARTAWNDDVTAESSEVGYVMSVR